MDDTVFLATWDDTSNVGVVNMSKKGRTKTKSSPSHWVIDKYQVLAPVTSKNQLRIFIEGLLYLDCCASHPKQFIVPPSLRTTFPTVWFSVFFKYRIDMLTLGHSEMTSGLNQFECAWSIIYYCTRSYRHFRITYQRKALHLNPDSDSHADMPGCLNNLANGDSFQSRFQTLTDLSAKAGYPHSRHAGHIAE